MQTGTIARCIHGEVFVKQEASEKRVVDSLKLKEKAEVKTGPESYAIISDNPAPDSGKSLSSALLFPKSRVTILVKRGYIKEIEVLHGQAMVSAAPGVKVFTPVVEFTGASSVEVSSDGKTTVANTRETIYNRKTRRAVILDVNQQVLITEDTVGEIEPMDQRFYQMEKIRLNLGAFYGSQMYQQVADKSDALMDAYLVGLKSLAEKTGQDFEKLKEQAIQEHQRYKQWAQSEAEKCREESEKIKKSDLSTASTMIPIEKSVHYQGLELKIVSVKRDSKSVDTDLLSVKIEATNESGKQIYVFWNEEARLINEKGENFPIDDYTLEISFMGVAQAKGYLFIPVNKQDKKFTLQFGKKSLPKVDLELDLSKTKGGD